MEEQNNQINSKGLKCEERKEDYMVVSKRFYCHECNFLFSQKSLLDAHMVKHFQFHCPNCEYTTYAAEDLENHKRCHDECSNLLKCSKCNFTAKTNKSLSKHEQKHNRPFSCVECVKTFSQELYLKAHIAKVHMKRKFYSCNEDNCSFSTDHKSSLINHERKHTRPFICSECGKGFAQEKTRDNHILNDHKEVKDKEKETESKPLSCTICDFKCQSKSNFQDHMFDQHLSPIFICNDDKCYFTTNHKSSLINHIRKHTRPFLCKECGKGFTHEKIRDAHFLNDHKNVEDKQIINDPEPLSCTVCEFKCSSRIDLQDHSNNYHSKPSSDCQKSNNEVDNESKYKSQMVTHLNNHASESSETLKNLDVNNDIINSSNIKKDTNLATDKKINMCSICEQSFDSDLHLKWHSLTHGDDTYFSCSECEYKTKKEYKLESHSKIHIGKLLACQECKYVTEDEQLLQKHMRTHKKEKKKLDKTKSKELKQKCELSFICSYCSVECTSLKKLTKHMQSHGNNDLKKETCEKHQTFEGKNSETLNIKQMKSDTKLLQELYLRSGLEITRVDKKSIKTFTCSIYGCEEEFSSLGFLKEHINSHNEENVYSCKNCDYRCLKMCDLEEHENIHRQNPLKVCTLMENNMKESDMHENTVNSTKGNFTMPKKCPKCKISFSSKSDLAKHIKSHKLHKMFVCNICTYKDKRLYNVVIHKEKEHGQLSRLKCDKCSFKTCGLRRLEAHRLSHSIQIKSESEDVKSMIKENKHLISYDIDAVHQTFTEIMSSKSKILSSVINKHRNNEHTKSKTVSNLDRNHICSICNCAFMSHSGLHKHMIIHSKEKKWSCHLCPYKTHWGFNLKKHKEKCRGIKIDPIENQNSKLKKSSISNLDKNHICSICNYTFKSRSGLYRHMVTHTKEKKWSCSFCPYKTHWGFNLKQHKATCTGMKHV